jgi:hypothetical protein
MNLVFGIIGFAVAIILTVYVALSDDSPRAQHNAGTRSGNAD